MDGLATLDDSPAVFDWLCELIKECERTDEEGTVARLRVLAIANDVCDADMHDPQEDWWWAHYTIRREVLQRRAAAVERSESADLLFAEEAALAVERFDEWWARLCGEPADDTEPEPEEATMSTATKRKRTKPEFDAWHTADGETWWRCPDCRNAHSEVVRACSCGRVRPALEKLTIRPHVPEESLEAPPADLDQSNGKVRGVGLVNGTVAWECPSCGTMNDAAEKRCGACNAPAVQPIEALAGRTDWDVPIAKVQRRGDNPRQTFDPAKLQQLADSIQAVGLISRIVVRATTGSGWELWAGERRLRACELLGWQKIPARVFPEATPDATMEAIRAWENLQREDLDEIEEARSLRQLLASGAYASQKELGAALPKPLSQGELSLRLRLTELPEEWQQRVIAREISTSHAKHLYPYLDLPAVLSKIAQKAAEWEKGHGRQPSERDFKSIVQNGARSASKPIGKGGYGQAGCPFTVSKELRAQLDVRPVPQPWGGKPEPRAFNVQLWNQKAKEAKKRAQQKAEPEASGGKKSGKPSAPSGPQTYALEERLGLWAKRQIRERLKPQDKKLIQRLLVAACLVGDGYNPVLTDVLKTLQVKRQPHYGDTAALWLPIVAVDEQTLATLMYETVLAGCHANYGGWPDHLAVAVASTLGADVEECWKPEAADLDLYDDKALSDLVERHGYEVGNVKGRKAIIAALVEAWKPGDLPKEFADALKG